ncbi:MAG: DUF3060 domain-containing protein [Propionibacteriaceae bacterium]|nr:DUF3060 domain-containing protein [Propionibacteriaceae bacterium]
MRTLSLRTGLAAAAVLLFTGCSAAVDAKPADAPAPDDLQSQMPNVPVKTIEGDVNVEANASNGETVGASAEGTETIKAPETPMPGEGRTGSAEAVACEGAQVVSADNSFVQIAGDCPSITISANNADVYFDGAGELTITGKDNHVQGKKAGAVTVSEADNDIYLETSGDLKITAGKDNFFQATETGNITVESDDNDVYVGTGGDLKVSGNENFIKVSTKKGAVDNSGSSNTIL